MTKELNVGIAGLGTVGQALISILQKREERLTLRTGVKLKIVAVSANSKNKERSVDISDYAWFDDPVELAKNPKIDIYVELIGGSEGKAKESIEAALQAGKKVVTANKALLSAHGISLAKLAEKNNAKLFYEAAVAGGIPVIKTLRESLAGNSISAVYGILNGTCNYILTKMLNEGRGFDEVLSEAQEKGYAEADPSFDIDGDDTAHKLAILSSLAFGAGINEKATYVQGIRGINIKDLIAIDKFGYRVKLLGIARRTIHNISQTVYPALVRKDSAIADVSSVTNAVVIEGDAIEKLMLVGPGAGGSATASAVVGDLIDAAHGFEPHVFGRKTADFIPIAYSDIKDRLGAYYLRFIIQDKAGAFAKIAENLGKNGISLKVVHQGGEFSQSDKQDAQDVFILTYDCKEESMLKAIEEINQSNVLVTDPVLMRIEEL